MVFRETHVDSSVTFFQVEKILKGRNLESTLCDTVLPQRCASSNKAKYVYICIHINTYDSSTYRLLTDDGIRTGPLNYRLSLQKQKTPCNKPQIGNCYDLFGVNNCHILTVLRHVAFLAILSAIALPVSKWIEVKIFWRFSWVIAEPALKPNRLTIQTIQIRWRVTAPYKPINAKQIHREQKDRNLHHRFASPSLEFYCSENLLRFSKRYKNRQ